VPGAETASLEQNRGAKKRGASVGSKATKFSSPRPLVIEVESFKNRLRKGLVRILGQKKMDLDDELDDAPPLLVADDGNPAAEDADCLEATMGEMSITKVPITIVTGMSTIIPVMEPALILYRIPGSWQDNITKLHSHRTTRQENCRDLKRVRQLCRYREIANRN